MDIWDNCASTLQDRAEQPSPRARDCSVRTAWRSLAFTWTSIGGQGASRGVFLSGIWKGVLPGFLTTLSRKKIGSVFGPADERKTLLDAVYKPFRAGWFIGDARCVYTYT